MDAFKNILSYTVFLQNCLEDLDETYENSSEKFYDYYWVFQKLKNYNSLVPEQSDWLLNQKNPLKTVAEDYLHLGAVNEDNFENNLNGLIICLREQEFAKKRLLELLASANKETLDNWLYEYQNWIYDGGDTYKIEYDSIVNSFCYVVKEFGAETAIDILNEGFLFPDEIKAAGVYLSQGGDKSNIQAMRCLGYLADGEEFEPLTAEERKEIEEEKKKMELSFYKLG